MTDKKDLRKVLEKMKGIIAGMEKKLESDDRILPFEMSYEDSGDILSMSFGMDQCLWCGGNPLRYWVISCTNTRFVKVKVTDEIHKEELVPGNWYLCLEEPIANFNIEDFEKYKVKLFLPKDEYCYVAHKDIITENYYWKHYYKIEVAE